MVLILKGDDRDFLWIDLIEVFWKNATGLLNRCFTLAIQFHDVLRGFWGDSEMGTTTLEYKLLQQLTSMREAVFYEIFMDLQKAYTALEWDSCLKIIEMYGVGPRAL